MDTISGTTTRIGLVLACIVTTGESMMPRFKQWFENSAPTFADISENTCNATLAAFENAYNNYDDQIWIDVGLYPGRPIYDLCRDQVSCILENVSEAQKASMGTANIVLGLLPTLLIVLAPSAAELALLSSQRPLLTCVLSFGAPGLLHTRIFGYEDPNELLDSPEGSKTRVRAPLVLGPWTSNIARAAGVVEWLLVCACATNTVQLATELSSKAIISWGCTRTWPVMVWVFVPFGILGISALGYRTTLNKRRIPAITPALEHKRRFTFFGEMQQNEGDSKRPNATANSIAVYDQTSAVIHGPRGGIADWMRREITSCTCHLTAFRPREPRDEVTVRVRIGVFMACVAGFLSFFFLLYGTVVFSSLLFIDTIDTLIIAMRFIASAVICRLVVLVEISGMRGYGDGGGSLNGNMSPGGLKQASFVAAWSKMGRSSHGASSWLHVLIPTEGQ